jgi:hypothetical protein
MRWCVPLGAAVLLAACEDPIIGTWTSTVGASHVWIFDADGEYHTTTRHGPHGTWSREDDDTLTLCPFASCDDAIYLVVVQDEDRLLAGRIFSGSGTASETVWGYSEQDCCQNGAPFTRSTTISLRADGTAYYSLVNGVGTGGSSGGTWTETALGFDFVLDNPNVVVPASGSFAVMSGVASPDAFARD